MQKFIPAKLNLFSVFQCGFFILIHIFCAKYTYNLFYHQCDLVCCYINSEEVFQLLILRKLYRVKRLLPRRLKLMNLRSTETALRICSSAIIYRSDYDKKYLRREPVYSNLYTFFYRQLDFTSEPRVANEILAKSCLAVA